MFKIIFKGFWTVLRMIFKGLWKLIKVVCFGLGAWTIIFTIVCIIYGMISCGMI